MSAQAKEIERNHLSTLKPIVKNLALFESFSSLPSQEIYTKTIAMVPVAQPLPEEFDKKIKFIFNGTKREADIASDQAMARAKMFIEDNLTVMLANIITEGDKRKQPIQLSNEVMRKFLASYE